MIGSSCLCRAQSTFGWYNSCKGGAFPFIDFFNFKMRFGVTYDYDVLCWRCTCLQKQCGGWTVSSGTGIGSAIGFGNNFVFCLCSIPIITPLPTFFLIPLLTFRVGVVFGGRLDAVSTSQCNLLVHFQNQLFSL